MIGSDSFLSAFGAIPADDLSLMYSHGATKVEKEGVRPAYAFNLLIGNLANLVKSMTSAGFHIVLCNPGSKVAMCTFVGNTSRRKREAADEAAREMAREAGNRRWASKTHACGISHAITAETFTTGGVQGIVRDCLYGRYRSTCGVPNIAVVPGPSRMAVVDVDTTEQLHAFWDAWGSAEGMPEGVSRESLTVRSPGKIGPDGTMAHYGGGHLWFHVPEGLSLPTEVGSYTHPTAGWTFTWGDDHYVLVPPSSRAEGPYQLVGAPRDTVPTWLVSVARDHAAEVIRVRAERDAAIQARRESGGPSLCDDWSALNPWETILPDDGWIETGRTSNCGCPEWTAPGSHGSAKSATAHGVGCDTKDTSSGWGPLHIWTDNPPEQLADRRDWAPVKYVAAMRFDGNMSAACEALGIDFSTVGGDDYDRGFDPTAGEELDPFGPAPEMLVTEPEESDDTPFGSGSSASEEVIRRWLLALRHGVVEAPASDKQVYAKYTLDELRSYMVETLGWTESKYKPVTILRLISTAQRNQTVRYTSPTGMWFEVPVTWAYQGNGNQDPRGVWVVDTHVTASEGFERDIPVLELAIWAGCGMPLSWDAFVSACEAAIGPDGEPVPQILGLSTRQRVARVETRYHWDARVTQNMAQLEEVSEESDVATDPEAFTVPEALWETTGFTRWLREVAREARLSPEVVLMDCLTRISGFKSPLYSPVSGNWRPPLNLFTVCVGGPGSGKGKAWSLASQIVPPPRYLVDRFPNGNVFSLENRAAIIQAFHDLVEIEQEEPPPSDDKPKRGRPAKPKTENRRVRDSVLVYFSEILTLVKLASGERGESIYSTLTALLTSDEVIMSNATRDLRRRLEQDSYAFAIRTGAQPEFCRDFISEDAAKTGLLSRTMFTYQPRDITKSVTDLVSPASVEDEFFDDEDDLREGFRLDIPGVDRPEIVLDRIVGRPEDFSVDSDPMCDYVPITTRIKVSKGIQRFMRDFSETDRDDETVRQADNALKLAALLAIADNFGVFPDRKPAIGGVYWDFAWALVQASDNVLTWLKSVNASAEAKADELTAYKRSMWRNLSVSTRKGLPFGRQIMARHVGRTLSVVEFTLALPPQFRDHHKEILETLFAEGRAETVNGKLRGLRAR